MNNQITITLSKQDAEYIVTLLAVESVRVMQRPSPLLTNLEHYEFIQRLRDHLMPQLH